MLLNVVLSLAAQVLSADSLQTPGLFVFFRTVLNSGFNILYRNLGIDRIKT